MRLLVLLLTLAASGCASSGFVGSLTPPLDYAPPVTGEAPALDSVNAALASGRFTIAIVDERDIRDVRQIEIGSAITRVVRRSGATPQIQYVPTELVASVAKVGKASGADVGAFVGALPGTALAVAGLVSLNQIDCSGAEDSYCALGALFVIGAVGVGFLAAAAGGVLGVVIGAAVSPSRPDIVLYQGPVARYLPETTPAVESDL